MVLQTASTDFLGCTASIKKDMRVLEGRSLALVQHTLHQLGAVNSIHDTNLGLQRHGPMHVFQSTLADGGRYVPYMSST